MIEGSSETTGQSRMVGIPHSEEIFHVILVVMVASREGGQPNTYPVGRCTMQDSLEIRNDTADGRIPAPPDLYKAP